MGLTPLKTDYVGQDLSGKKLFKVDFSYQDLTRVRIRRSTCYQCNFDFANMTEVDAEGTEFFGSTFRDTVCYRTNFKDAKLAATEFAPRDCMGMTMTMQCKTFDQMKVSPMWWLGWLFLATMMIPVQSAVEKEKEDLAGKLLAVFGAERYARLHALFSKRNI